MVMATYTLEVSGLCGKWLCLRSEPMCCIGGAHSCAVLWAWCVTTDVMRHPHAKHFLQTRRKPSGLEGEAFQSADSLALNHRTQLALRSVGVPLGSYLSLQTCTLLVSTLSTYTLPTHTHTHMFPSSACSPFTCFLCAHPSPLHVPCVHIPACAHAPPTCTLPHPPSASFPRAESCCRNFHTQTDYY